MGLNFASALKHLVGVINQYAISTPTSGSNRGRNVCPKSGWKGAPFVQVDGNDILAVYVVVKEAIERARKGEGPSLVEAYIPYGATHHIR